MLIDPDEDSHYADVSNGLDQIIGILSEVKGVEIVNPEIDGVQVESKVLFTNEISEYELRQFDKWDFDYLSFVNDANGEIMDAV